MAPRREPSAVGWEVIAPGPPAPGPRNRHGLVYDRRAKVAVLFGGVVWKPRATLQSDTWELGDGVWSLVAQGSVAPRARHRGAMVYDDRRGRSVLFGGESSQGELLADTWTYADQVWQPWAAKRRDQRPGPRAGHCMAFDEAAGLTVLFGGVEHGQNSLGDTWLFDGTEWTEVKGSAPPPRRYAALAYDPDLKGCLLHGGSDDETGRRGFGDAWLYRDGGWRKLGGGFETEPRDDHGLAYHRKAGCMVMLEGVAGRRGILVRGENGWRPVQASPLHPRHQCSPLAWDEEIGALVLHGGEAAHGGPKFTETLALMIPASL